MSMLLITVVAWLIERLGYCYKSSAPVNSDEKIVI